MTSESFRKNMVWKMLICSKISLYKLKLNKMDKSLKIKNTSSILQKIVHFYLKIILRLYFKFITLFDLLIKITILKF